jgi:outer membrane lipoprotein SlyB
MAGFITLLMKTSFPAALLVASFVSLPAAHAADTPKPVTEVHGVKLASICSACGVVSNARTETRKGKSSGVGVVGGAVVGGVVGHQFGGGGGKTAMTALGAVGGAVAGNEVEKNMKKYTVWVTTVTFKDGRKRTFERTSNPELRAGDVVTLSNGHPVRHTG